MDAFQALSGGFETPPGLTLAIDVSALVQRFDVSAFHSICWVFNSGPSLVWLNFGTPSKLITPARFKSPFVPPNCAIPFAKAQLTRMAVMADADSTAEARVLIMQGNGGAYPLGLGGEVATNAIADAIMQAVQETVQATADDVDPGNLTTNFNNQVGS